MSQPLHLPRLPRLSTVLWAAGGLTVLTFAVYWASLTNKFVDWDDTYVIYFNPAIKHITPRTLWRIFTSYDPELYVPFTMFTYQIDYLLAGLNPVAFHLQNLLWHTGSMLLVLWLSFLLTRDRLAAVVTAALFALHPLHVEAVAWASARKDVLSTFWFLASFLFYLHYRESGSRRPYAGSIVAFALSLLAKVMTLTLPIVLLLLDWRDRRTDWKRALPEKIPYAALSLLFGVIGMFGKKDINAASTLWEKILMAAKSTTFYLQKLVAPVDLAVAYPYRSAITLSSPDFFVPLAIVAVLIIALLFIARRSRFIAFCGAFFLITLTPTFINFLKAGNAYVASDRYAYVPSIGVFLLVGLGCALLAERRRMRTSVITVTSLVIAGLCLLTYRQSLVWKNSETLFLHNLEIHPDAIPIRLNLADVYRDSKRGAEARAQLNEALKIEESAHVYASIAALDAAEGRDEEALAKYAKAESLDPDDTDAPFGMGIVEAERKNYAAAERHYLRALKINPLFTGIYNNLGALYLEQDRLDEAEAAFLRAMEIDPHYVDARYNYAHLLDRKNDLEGSIAAYYEVLALDPDYVDVMLLLAPVQVKAGKLEDAIETARAALDREPDDPEVQAMAFDVIKGVAAKDPKNKSAKALLDEMMERGMLKKRGS